MPAHNVVKEINDAEASGDAVVQDFGNEGIKADVIAESTSATGVTADGVLMKDGAVTATGTIIGASVTANAGSVTCAGVTSTAQINTVGFVDTENQAVTATTGGGTTGLIPAGTTLCTVSSDSADKQISLPIASIGQRLRIVVGGSGCELISAVAAHKVNGITVGATNEAALVATSVYDLHYYATNLWIMQGWTALGDAEAVVVPDAL